MTKSLWVAGAVAAMLGASSVAKADDVTTTTTTDTTVTVPDVSFPGSDVPLSSYALLSNRTFDGIDITQARAEGYSDRDIAAMAKIADYSGLTFGEVKSQILNGATYYQVAEENGVPEADLFRVNGWEDKVSAYRDAWNHTGRKAARQLVSASEETYTAPMTTTTTNSWSNSTPMVPAPDNTTTGAPKSTTPGTDNNTTPSSMAPAPDNNLSAPPAMTTPDNGATGAPKSTTPDTDNNTTPAPAAPTP